MGDEGNSSLGSLGQWLLERGGRTHESLQWPAPKGVVTVGRGVVSRTRLCCEASPSTAAAAAAAAPDVSAPRYPPLATVPLHLTTCRIAALARSRPFAERAVRFPRLVDASFAEGDIIIAEWLKNKLRARQSQERAHVEAAASDPLGPWLDALPRAVPVLGLWPDDTLDSLRNPALAAAVRRKRPLLFEERRRVLFAESDRDFDGKARGGAQAGQRSAEEASFEAAWALLASRAFSDVRFSGPAVEQILFPPPELWDNPNEDALVMRGLQARLAAAVLRVHSARAEQPTFSEQELEHIGSSEAEARAALRASTGTITWGSTMVPVVDMFNHAPNATSSFGLVQSSDGTFHFTLNSLHQPETGASEGEWREVFISYGAGRPSADLLACYGFCLPFPLCCDPGRPAPGSASDGGDRHSLLLRFNTAEFRPLLLADRGGEDEGGEEGEDEAAQDKLVDVFDEVEAHPLLRDAFEVDRLFWAAEVTLQRPYDPPTATNVLLVLSSALIRAIAGPEGAAARLRLEAALARLLRRRLAALRAILSSSAAPSMSTVWEMAAAFPESTALACLAASPGGEVLAATGSGVLAVGSCSGTAHGRSRGRRGDGGDRGGGSGRPQPGGACARDWPACGRRARGLRDRARGRAAACSGLLGRRTAPVVL
jgi:hypothetical protein